jgi:hypothetical protein
MINTEPTKFDAVRALVDGTIGGSSDAEIINYHNGQTPPTKKAIESKYAELCQEWIDQEYARNRRYPTWQEQMDMQYHDQLNGTTTWKDAVAKVKSDNPKPE